MVPVQSSPEEDCSCTAAAPHRGTEEACMPPGERAGGENGASARDDQPSGDYETCQHPAAKDRYTSHHVAALSRPCRERV
eukprot:5248307-Prymnesium_polylepis.1